MENTIIPAYFSKPTTMDDEQIGESLQLLHHYDDHHQLDNLSLRDLPIAASSVDSSSQPPRSASTAAVNHSRHSSTSSSSDPTSDFFFEFLINNDDDLITSTADDVIFRGRLLPYYAPPPPRAHPRRSLSLSSAAARLTRPQLTESSSPPNSLPTIRPSRSLNYRKLRRNRSNAKPKMETIHRSSCNGNNNNTRFNSDKIPAKLPWYWALVFGLPKIPAEMELKDIKNRQFRRNSTPPPPPPPPTSRYISGDRNCSSASWKLLNVLSCKSHATVDVSNTTPFRNSLF